MRILALDVRPSNVRAAVLDVETGQPRGDIARAEIAIDTPGPDAAEISVTCLWEAVASAARQAVRQSGVAGQPGQDVAAVGLTTFLPGLVLLGKDQPLAPIWTPWDRRARPAARQAWAHVGEEFLAATGHRPVPGIVSALAWRQLLTIDPYFSHRTHSFLHVNGWLAFHMTGVKAFDAGNGSCSGLFGTLTDGQWSPRWCDYFEIDRAWLPPVMCGSATVGTLRSGIANELGVPAGVPVKLGVGDIASAMFAARMEPGDLLHIVGATQTLAALTDRPAAAPRRWTRRLGVGPRFMHVTHNPVGIEALGWIRALCFREQSEDEFYTTTIARARDGAPRVSLDPPFLAGDCLEIEACRAAFRDLELTTDRLDLLAALLDAMVKRHREAVANLGMGVAFRRIFLAGAGAERVRQLLPEYATATIETLTEGALRGVARLFATEGIQWR
jgi:xylulokinase